MNGSLRANPATFRCNQTSLRTFMKTWTKHLLLFAAALLAAPLLAQARLYPQGNVAAEQGLRGVPQKGERRRSIPNGARANTSAATSAATSATWRSRNEVDAYEHYGQIISTIVTPKDCGRCHEQEVAEFNSSHHAKAGRILGSLDNVLAEVVEGNRGFKTPMFPAAFPPPRSTAAGNATAPK